MWEQVFCDAFVAHQLKNGVGGVDLRALLTTDTMTVSSSVLSVPSLALNKETREAAFLYFVEKSKKFLKQLAWRHAKYAPSMLKDYNQLATTLFIEGLINYDATRSRRPEVFAHAFASKRIINTAAQLGSPLGLNANASKYVVIPTVSIEGGLRGDNVTLVEINGGNNVEEFSRYLELRQAFEVLSETQKYVLDALFGLSGREYKLKELAQEMGRTEREVASIRDVALFRLRGLLCVPQAEI